MNDQLSPREFDDYVGLLGRLLRLRASQREAIAEELRVHLEERFAALTGQGVEPRQAISMALAEFGDAAALAVQFSSVAKLQKRRWMMRIGVSSAVTVLLAVAVAISMWPDSTGQLSSAMAQAQQTGEKKEPADVLSVVFSESNANAVTMAKLERIGSAEFQDDTLGGALEYLAKLGGFQVYVDPQGLEEGGVAPDTPVTLALRDVPIEMLLRRTLMPLDLTYTFDHGVVVITTPGEERANPKIRVYRVDDLVRPAERLTLPGVAAVWNGNLDTADCVRLCQRGPGGPPGGLGRRPGITREPSDSPDMEALINLITRVVEPQLWESVGGSGVIAEYRGALVVTQPTRIQMKIEKLLGELRETVRSEKPPISY